MNLFKLEDYEVKIDPQAFVLAPFKKVWKKNKYKDVAMKELAYIWFMCDYTSDFSDILDDDERHKEVSKAIFNKEDYKPDKYVNIAMEFYKERSEGLATRLLESAKILIKKIDEFCRNVDLEERDEKNKPIFNINQINNLVKQLAESIESINKLEKIIKKDVSEKKMIGSKKKNIFEDGL